jgi:hypothetical protein
MLPNRVTRGDRPVSTSNLAVSGPTSGAPVVHGRLEVVSTTSVFPQLDERTAAAHKPTAFAERRAPRRAVGRPLRKNRVRRQMRAIGPEPVAR